MQLPSSCTSAAGVDGGDAFWGRRFASGFWGRGRLWLVARPEKAKSDSPEVAIIDLMLPEPMDGWGLLNELRARGQKVPVIFYTAYPVFPSGTDDPDVVGYMSKAVDRADLYALLPPAIRRSRERRAES